MKHPLAINVAVEGVTDGSIVRRILRDHGVEVLQVSGLRGKGHLDAKLPAYNAAARFSNWLVVRDLDSDAGCAPTLVRAKLRTPSDGMRFRIAVRAIEAWLLADAIGVASHFQVRSHDVPHDPESLRDPKGALVKLARISRSRLIRYDMVPAAKTTARVGPGFVAQVLSFADSKWSWKRAMERSDSLRRFVEGIAARP